jgi:hypothetical protein
VPGASQAAAAALVGVSLRMMRFYLTTGVERSVEAPYSVQFAIECLALASGGRKRRSIAP